MRSKAIFKGKKGEHKMLQFYYNPHKTDKNKAYLMISFAQTTESQTVGGNTVGKFRNTDKAKVATFGMSLHAGFDDYGTLCRFLERDSTVFKKEHTKEGKGFSICFIHKKGNSDKSLYLGQFENGGHYLTLMDRKQKDFMVNIPLTSSEMYVLGKFCNTVLDHYDRQDVESFGSVVENTDDVPLPPDQQADDDMPF